MDAGILFCDVINYIHVLQNVSPQSVVMGFETYWAPSTTQNTNVLIVLLSAYCKWDSILQIMKNLESLILTNLEIVYWRYQKMFWIHKKPAKMVVIWGSGKMPISEDKSF